jgi:hypothetical protein
MKSAILIILVMILISPAAGATRLGAADASGLAIGLTSQTPDPAAAGQPAEARLSLQNTGGKQIDNLSMELVPVYPIEAIPGEPLVQYVGSLMGYQGVLSGDDTQIIKYRFMVSRDATAGTYDVKVKYYNGEMAGEQTFSISVANKQAVEISSIDKTLLTPGNQTSLTFTIRNVGSSSLRNLVFSWENSDGVILPVGSDNTKHIAYLDVGQSAQASYDVVADSTATAGLYKLKLSLTYDDSATGAESAISTFAGIYVGGGTDFDVALSDSSSGTTSFSVANIGSNPAYSVSVKVPDQAGWRATGSSSAVIGNLNAGDYTVTSFSLAQVSRNSTVFPPQGSGNFSAGGMRTAGASNRITLEIAYTDTTGARRVVEKQVTMASSATSTGNSTASAQFGPNGVRFQRQESVFVRYGGYFAGAGVTIVVVVAYLFYRAKKKDDPDLTVKKLVGKVFAKPKRK